MRFYIDPGTGSMLFAILIGIIGAVTYMLKSWLLKLRFVLSGGKKVDTGAKKIPLVIFSDDKRYWSVFRPVCRELDKKGIDTVYMTASPDDPALENDLPHIHAQFIEEGNKAFAKLNFLNASVVLATTPGLDVYQWKRSKQVDYYVHLPHAASDISGYRMFGIDYYDAILLSGQYQVEQVRALEKLRALPPRRSSRSASRTWMICSRGCTQTRRCRSMSARCCSHRPGARAPSSKNTAAGSSTPCLRRGTTSSSARTRSRSAPSRT